MGTVYHSVGDIRRSNSNNSGITDSTGHENLLVASVPVLREAADRHPPMPMPMPILIRRDDRDLVSQAA